MRLRVLVSTGIVLGVMLLASVVFADPFPDPGYGVGSSDLWVMNVHETLNANVVVSLLDRDGYPSSHVAATIGPNWNYKFAASSSGVDSGWLGSAAIDSLRPIASMVATNWVGTSEGDGRSAAAYIDATEGAHEIYFPGVSKSSYWWTIVTIQCLDTEDCQVSMTYRDTSGNTVAGSPYEDTIQAFSQETYDPWDPSVNPNIPENEDMPSAWHGSLRVTSPQRIAGVAVTHCRRGHARAYNACVRTEDTQVHFPSVNRRNWNNWTGQSDWSGLSVQNTNPFTITLAFNFYNKDGSLKLRFEQSDVPPYTAYNCNLKNDERFSNWENVWLGSAVVTSTHPIVGVCSGERYAYGKVAGSVTGVPGGSGKLVFPVVYRRAVGGSTWRKFSGIVVKNPDPENEITVHTYWYLTSSDFIHISVDIPPNGYEGFNTRYGTHAEALSALGNNWYRTVVVTTDSPLGIAAVASTTYTFADYAYMYSYNGIPVE